MSKSSLQTSILGILVVATTSVFAQERQNMKARLPSIVVAGMPIPLEVTLSGPASIVAPQLLEDLNPWSVRLIGNEVNYICPPHRTREAPAFRKGYHEPEPDLVVIPVPPLKVDKGSRAAFLFDLTDLCIAEVTPSHWIDVNASSLLPGSYTVEISESPWSDDPPLYKGATVQIVEPNDIEKQFLDRLDAIESDRPKWEKFILDYDEVFAGISIEMLSDAGQRQMGYYMLLAELVHDERVVGELRITEEMIPANFWPGYVPAVLLLRLEIAAASGDTVEVAVLKDAIRLQGGAPREIVDRIETRGGIIQSLRSRLANTSRDSAATADEPETARDK